jgi:chemotaxis protein MotB
MKKYITIILLVVSITSCVPPGKLNDALEANTKLEIKYDSFYQSHKDTVAVIANSINSLKVTVQGLSDSVNFYREIAMKPVALTKGDILFDKIVKAGVLTESDLNNIALTENKSNIEGGKFLTALKNDVKTITGAASDLKMGKGFIYVDVSTKLLFNSGKNTLTSKANLTLIQIAKLLNNNPDVEVMIEGHTDNKLFKSSAKIDNWDLSVQRATSVVRILQTKYKVNPSRIIAAGRSEYMPIDDNNSTAGLANNRYIRIVLMPTLKQVLMN